MQARTEVGGKEKGRRESWGRNLVVASFHGVVQASGQW